MIATNPSAHLRGKCKAYPWAFLFLFLFLFLRGASWIPTNARQKAGYVVANDIPYHKECCCSYDYNLRGKGIEPLKHKATISPKGTFVVYIATKHGNDKICYVKILHIKNNPHNFWQQNGYVHR